MLSLVLFAACAARVPPAPAWTRPEYFLPAELHPDPGIGALRQDWYAQALSRLGEPSFRELARRPGRAWRFLWLRTWHPALVVRLHPVGHLAVAEVRRLDGRGRPEALGYNVQVQRRTVSAQEWGRFQAEIDRLDFWEMPGADPSDPVDLDGARWVFEGLQDGRTHVVDRFSPDQPELVELGLFMLHLAGVEIDPQEVY